MIARLGRQIVGTVISGFALLGFAFVQLGDRTGLEHACAILATPEAERAVKGFVTQLQSLKQQFFKVSAPASAPEMKPRSPSGGSSGKQP